MIKFIIYTLNVYILSNKINVIAYLNIYQNFLYPVSLKFYKLAFIPRINFNL